MTMPRQCRVSHLLMHCRLGCSAAFAKFPKQNWADSARALETPCRGSRAVTMLGIIHDSKGIQSNMYFEAANFDGKDAHARYSGRGGDSFCCGLCHGHRGSVHMRDMKCSEWFTGD